MGRTFFPQLISGPFQTGLHEAFIFAIVACLVAAAASLLRGGVFYHAEEAGTFPVPTAHRSSETPDTAGRPDSPSPATPPASPTPVAARNGGEPAGDRVHPPARVT